ncbi:Klhl12, partial [Symbiodinium necroappetens]
MQTSKVKSNNFLCAPRTSFNYTVEEAAHHAQHANEDALAMKKALAKDHSLTAQEARFFSMLSTPLTFLTSTFAITAAYLEVQNGWMLAQKAKMLKETLRGNHGMSCGRRHFAAALAVCTVTVAASCQATEVSAVVGGLTVHLAVPALLEGDSFQRSCESLRAGFEGFIRVSCFGSQPVPTIRCQAKGCLAGQRAPARIGDSAELLPAAIEKGLAHGKEEFLPCRTLKEGLEGYIHLRCSLGVLSADAASCRSTPRGARTAYRLLNADFLPGAWRVFEAHFYDNADCQGGRWMGELYGSSEEAESGCLGFRWKSYIAPLQQFMQKIASLVSRLISDVLGRGGIASSVLDGEAGIGQFSEAYLFGGHDGEMPLKVVESFRPSENLEDRGEWKELPPMLARRTYASASELDGKIYVMGGSADGRTLNTFEVFEPKAGQWDQWFTKPPMNIKRTMHAAAVADGRIYVAGGFDGIRDLSAAEIYDPRSNSWSSHIDPMSVPRSYHCMVAVQNCIYAIGGQQRQVKADRPRAHSSVEAFELYCERWLEAPPMSTGRIGAGACLMEDENGNNFIYVTGGSDGDTVLQSGEVFDVKRQTWQELPPMAFPRIAHTSFVLNGKLYVAGGIDGKVPLETFECFDPSTKTWSAPMRL